MVIDIYQILALSKNTVISSFLDCSILKIIFIFYYSYWIGTVDSGSDSDSDEQYKQQKSKVFRKTSIKILEQPSGKIYLKFSKTK